MKNIDIDLKKELMKINFVFVGVYAIFV